MSARTKLAPFIRTYPWAVLSESDRKVTFYRWAWDDDGKQHRLEVTVVFDKADRVDAWSVWRNYKQEHNQEPGMSKRLQEMVLAAILGDPNPQGENG